MVEDVGSGNGVVRRKLYLLDEGLHACCGFSFRPYGIPKQEDIPPYVSSLWLETAGRLNDHLNLNVGHPPGYGLAHNIKTGIYAFVFGGKYALDINKRLALLLAGTIHDACKESNDTREHEQKAAELANKWLAEMERGNKEAAEIRKTVVELVGFHDSYKLAYEDWAKKRDRSIHLTSEEAKKNFIKINTQLIAGSQTAIDDGFLDLLTGFSMGDIFDRTDRSRFIVAGIGKIKRKGDYKTIEDVVSTKWTKVRPDEFSPCDKLFDLFVRTYNTAMLDDHSGKKVKHEEIEENLSKYDPEGFLWASRDRLMEHHNNQLKEKDGDFAAGFSEGAAFLHKLFDELRLL